MKRSALSLLGAALLCACGGKKTTPVTTSAPTVRLKSVTVAGTLSEPGLVAVGTLPAVAASPTFSQTVSIDTPQNQYSVPLSIIESDNQETVASETFVVTFR